MRAGIRAHRDSTGHALCWHHPARWALRPERTDPLPTVAADGAHVAGVPPRVSSVPAVARRAAARRAWLRRSL